MTIRIHLGAHKTATTELQHAIQRVSGKLAEAGTGYIGPKVLRREDLSFSRSLVPEKSHAKAVNRLLNEFSSWLGSHDNHLLSEENIIGTTSRGFVFGKGGYIYPKAINRLKALLSMLGYPEVELFLAIRDPAQFVTSAYGQQLRAGAAIDISSYVGRARVSAMSWVPLVQDLLACPGVTRLVCWRYEDHTVLRPRILGEMLGPDLAGIVPEATWRHGGISEAAYRAFVETAMSDLETPVEVLLKGACQAYPKTAGVPGMKPLRRRVYSLSGRAYALDVKRISQLEGVTWLAPGQVDGQDPS
ncbi:MAG: hypothetical protein ACK5II_14410 [Paracoccus sp. (in: a-proteobacteria)]